MSKLKAPDLHISMSDTDASIRRSNQSGVTVAKVLGRRVTGKAPEQYEEIYLDRLVHRPFDAAADGWTVGGAISTVLRRQVQASADA